VSCSVGLIAPNAGCNRYALARGGRAPKWIHDCTGTFVSRFCGRSQSGPADGRPSVVARPGTSQLMALLICAVAGGHDHRSAA
jgi:hypothetical protein